MGTRQVEKGSVRQDAIGLKALSLEVEESLLAGYVRYFPHESRLPNASFPADKNDLSLSTPGPFDQSL